MCRSFAPVAAARSPENNGHDLTRWRRTITQFLTSIRHSRHTSILIETTERLRKLALQPTAFEHRVRSNSSFCPPNRGSCPYSKLRNIEKAAIPPRCPHTLGRRDHASVRYRPRQLQPLSADRLLWVWLYRVGPQVPEALDRGQMASPRVSGLLALAITLSWTAQDERRNP